MDAHVNTRSLCSFNSGAGEHEGDEGSSSSASERPPVVKRVATKFHWLIESLCREDTERPTLVVTSLLSSTRLHLHVYTG